VGSIRYNAGDCRDLRCRLLESRNVYFESWCIDTIARTLDKDPDLRPWRIPYLPAFVRLDGRRLVIGSRPVRELSPGESRVLAACDGQRHAKAIARELRSSSDPALISEDSIYAVLEDVTRAGYLIWTFEGARELQPERTLRERLDRVDDAVLRGRSSAVLEAIEATALAIRDAAGRPAALDRAIESLESTFGRLTGAAPTRRDGEIYAGRTLVYEDCRRDLSLELGPEIIDSLGPPLSLLLRSARWAIHEIARRHRAEFRRIFDDLARNRRGPVSFGLFVSRTSLFRATPGSLSPIGAEVKSALQQRWAAILKPPRGARRVDYRCRDLREAVQESFACADDPPCGWARAVSPDVMINAPNLDAIRRGEYQFVLGELHLINTLQYALFVDQHPSPAEIMRLLDFDHPDPRVIWIEPKEKTPHRTHLALRPTDFAYVCTRDPSPVPPERTLRLADLEVVDEAGLLLVQTRDGRHRFPSLEFFGGLMMRTELGSFGVLPPLPHQPRITIDSVVVCREQWRMRSRELVFAASGDSVERFVACQRWAQQHELPPTVFVKMPTEHKPTYVDFSSPVYVDAFARSAKTAQRIEPEGVITITEMLPTQAGAWLTDAAGRSYTCELRLVAVDQATVAPTGISPPRRAEPVTITP